MSFLDFDSHFFDASPASYGTQVSILGTIRGSSGSGATGQITVQLPDGTLVTCAASNLRTPESLGQ